MNGLIDEHKIEAEARIRSQKFYKRENDKSFDEYYERLLMEKNPYAMKLQGMTRKELEDEYIKKSEEIAKLPPSPVKVRKRTTKDGLTTINETLIIHEGNYLKTQLGLIEAALRKKNIESEKEKEQSTNEKKQQTIDQDDLIDKFRNACLRINLVKGKTIPPEILYKIGIDICPNGMPSQKKFKSGNKLYHKLRQYASLTEYKKKKEIT